MLIIPGSNSSDHIRSRPSILRYDRNGHPILLGFLMNSTCDIQIYFHDGKYSRTSECSKNGVLRQHFRMASLSASDIQKGYALSRSNTPLLHTVPTAKEALSDNSTNLDDKERRWTILIISISVAGTMAFIIIFILLLVLCLRRGRKPVTNEETKDRRNQYQFESLKIPSSEQSTSTVGSW